MCTGSNIAACKKTFFFFFTVCMHVYVHTLLTNKHNADNRRQHRNSVLNNNTFKKLKFFQFSRKRVIHILADLLVLIYKTWKKNTCKEIEVILNSIKGKTETPCRCENTLQLMGRAFKHNRKHKNGFSFVLLNLVASYYS